MRNLMSVGTAVIITMSITACANRNNTLNNDPDRTTNDRIVTPITQRYAVPNSTQIGKYNDGVYRGEGNIKNNRNEVAIVTVRNGAINNIDLMSVDNSGNVKYNGTNITDANNNRNITSTPYPYTTPGWTTSNAPNYTGISGGNGTNNIGTGTNTTASSLDSARTQLINSVITQQSANVNIATDASTKATVDNWKLSIQRALNKASK